MPQHISHPQALQRPVLWIHGEALGPDNPALVPGLGPGDPPPDGLEPLIAALRDGLLA